MHSLVWQLEQPSLKFLKNTPFSIQKGTWFMHFTIYSKGFRIYKDSHQLSDSFSFSETRAGILSEIESNFFPPIENHVKFIFSPNTLPIKLLWKNSLNVKFNLYIKFLPQTTNFHKHFKYLFWQDQWYVIKVICNLTKRRLK